MNAGRILYRIGNMSTCSGDEHRTSIELLSLIYHPRLKIADSDARFDSAFYQLALIERLLSVVIN